VRLSEWGNILRLVSRHYESDELAAQRLEALGAPKTAALLREKLPTTKKARSGEMGEILATEIAERHFGWRVPVRRLRWKDGRDMALRGDDLTGIWISKDNELWFLKGESKSRSGSIASAIGDASTALDRDRGRPSRLSVLFVAERLREQNEIALALNLESALTESFRGCTINQFLFALTGTDPEKLLTEHFGNLKKRRPRRYVVGLQVKDHADFIKKVYESLSSPVCRKK